ncbi:MAG: DNA-formamidopyrimidine glycosylase [Candidatus Paceibacterota bacterium]
MPELPEVETTVRGLKSRVLNRTFVDVWTDFQKMIKKPDNFAEFKKGIIGRKIVNIKRRAKNILIGISGGKILLIHQKMTGHLLVGRWKKTGNRWFPLGKGPLSDSTNSFIHLVFWLDKDMLALSDMRKFAKIELWDKKELENSEEFKKIGPEPLDKSFSFEKFKIALRDKKGKIKQVLMDPNVIAGIGNIYSDEILFRAKVHPLKRVPKLKENELKNIYREMKIVLPKAIKLGGESFSDFRKVDGSKGFFDKERKVYRREGENCPVCGNVIKRIKIGGRSAHFCPSCQKI